jgi:NAD/FAD-utilizing enzyme apparently involved in cell division
VLERVENLYIRQASVSFLIVKDGRVYGVRTRTGEEYGAKAVVIATGTFLNGLIHIGLESFPAGRLGDPPSNRLAENLKELGFKMGRFKTGTCPRLDGRSKTRHDPFSHVRNAVQDKPEGGAGKAGVGGGKENANGSPLGELSHRRDRGQQSSHKALG